MKDGLLRQAAQFDRKRHRKRLWYRAVSGMACVVVFCTVYALILPAITMEKAPSCGLEEHVHDETCYTVETVWPSTEYLCGEENLSGHVHDEDCRDGDGNLICGYADFVVHTHDERCYDRNGDLACPLEEIEEHRHGADCYSSTEVLTCGEEETGHIHGPACYTRVRGDRTCGQEESQGHTHGESCYKTERDLVCAMEEGGDHTHDDSCYVTREVLTCELEESQGHAHSDDCYDWTEELTCGLEEAEGHIHGADCYTTVTELVCDQEEVTLHTHDENCFDTEDCPLCAEEDPPEHTHPLICGKVQVLEHRHDGTCAVEPEGEPEEVRVLTCGREEHVHTDECYEPPIQQPAEEEPDHLCGLEEHTHSEDCYDEAGELTCGLAEHVHDESCLTEPEEPESEYEAAYGSLSELPDGTVVLPAEEPGAGEPAETGAYLFRYEDAAVEMAVQLTGDAPAAGTGTDPETDEALSEEESVSGETESASEGESVSGETEAALGGDAHGLVLAVIPQEEDSQAYRDAAEYAAAHAGEAEELCRVLAYEFRFFRDGAELDVSGCRVTVELSPKEAAVAAPVSQEEPAREEEPAQAEVPAAMRARTIAAAPAALEESGGASGEEQMAAEQTVEETAVRISVLQETDGGVTETDSALVAAEEAAGTVVRFTLQSSRLAVALSQTANPHFTVEYYAYVEQAQLSDSGDLAVINTDQGGINEGGNLPQNGVEPALKYLSVSGGGIVTGTSLVQVYRDHGYQYIEAPNLTYFNRLYENSNYALEEIWVQNDGDADWTVYTEPEALHFTNRESSVDGGTVLIRDGTRIRLVYDTTTGSYDNEASFYDYDITDGSWESISGWPNARKYNTVQQGINSAGNYSGSGSKLAFGNMNTGTGLENITWSGNTLNKGNSNGYGGCTFGLATDLNGGNIQYAAGVTAPNLFNEGSATGKRTYNDSSLTFARDGDTYTLTAASGIGGISISDLDTFTIPLHDEEYTNNFWPLDGVSDTVDPKFGDPNRNYNYLYKQYGNSAANVPRDAELYVYAISKWGTPSYTFPYADNGEDHNNYFGLSYAVSFDLTADYVGPLNYLFFGDDDMWVFLTDSQGNSWLVCDIGGVHSSVGEYVNLWDYIEKDTRTEDESYTLSFFYTERGASGSSCYMRFTLPSVSSVTPEQNTGELRVEKKVEGARADSGQEFAFDISFTDSNGNALPDDYSYSKYDAQGNYLLSDVIIYDGGSFTLKDGEYIIVKYLPYGTKYTITEAESPQSCRTTVQVNGGGIEESRTAAGAIPDSGERQNVLYTNFMQYVLPETGGTGTHWYTLGGLCLTAGALLLLYRSKTRGKGGKERPC